MAKKVKIEFEDEGFKKILKENSVAQLVIEQTLAIAQRAGEGFEGEVVWGYNNTRPVGFVHSTDAKSAKEEAENKVLSKAVK